jgi:subtilisin-like proprotein convertase family protein
MKFITLFCALVLFSVNYAQTFNGGSGAIIDYQTTSIPITVSVPETSINTTTFGLETVCINLTHTYLADLTIKLVAPDGTTKVLSANIGGGDDNMTNTCFNGFSAISIAAGSAPYTGTFSPMSQMGGVNNGQNPNGTWFITVYDGAGQDEGNVIDCSLTFGSSPCDYFIFSESDLPIVVIETNGLSIGNDVKTVVDMGIIDNGNGVRNHLTDSFNAYDGKIGIEYRGNYSLTLPQKPYALELIDDMGNSIDSALLGMPSEHDWLLLANYNDKSFTRNVIPNELFDSLGHYGVRSKHVDVVLDGEYQGIYLFSEKIKRDSNRVDIAKLLPTETIGQDVTGGYIFKVDYWDWSNSWQSNFSPIGFPGLDVHYVYYYPKPTDIVIEQQTYIQNFINELETTLYSPTFDDPVNGYRKYISTTSFIDYFIVNEVARNVDGYKKSHFFHKDKDHSDGTYSKLKAGPVWDFDWAFKDISAGSEDGSGFIYGSPDSDVNAPGWYIRLLEDTTFANELRCRYDDFRRNILSLPYLYAKVDSIAAVVNESQGWHYLTWGHLSADSGTPEVQAPPQTFAEEVQRLKDWITRRIEWLDINMPGTLNGCSFAGLNELGGIDFVVYPNPFNAALAIELSNTEHEEGTITLLDATGRICSRALINGQQKIELTNLGSLTNGVYFIEVAIGNRKTVQKLIK